MSFSYLSGMDHITFGDAPLGGVGDSPRLLSEKELVGLCRCVRDAPARVLVLCAESGMGKSHTINCLTCYEHARGSIVYNVSLSGSTEGDAPARLTRFAREVMGRARKKAQLVVTIDDVPAADEGAIAREVRAIRKIVSAGAYVVVALRPEASALAEAIDGAVVVGPTRLAARAGSPDSVVTRLSNGVPQLVAAMREDVDATGRVSPWGSSYSAALRRLVGCALRPTLPEEDLRLRLAMILLGRGSLDDLRAVDKRIDDEMLAWLEREAPVFGCSCATRTFAVAGVDDCEVLMDVYGALTVPCAPRQALVARCAEVLAMRGEYRRSGLVCGLCPDSRDSHALALAWGTEYVCAGMPKVVARGIEARREVDADESMGLFSDADVDAGERSVALAGVGRLGADGRVAADALSAWVLAELSGKVDVLADARGRAGAVCDEGAVPTCALRRASLIGVCRRMLGDLSEGERACESIEDDEFSAQLVTHARVVASLARGRVSGAFKTLVDSGARDVVDGLPSALLSDDLRVCEVLLGERDAQQADTASLRVDHVFQTVSSRRIDLYREAGREALVVLMGRGTSFEAGERAARRAVEYGDTLVEAALLVAAAIADLRSGACTRAYVRAERSRARASAAGSEFVEQAGLLVEVGARARLGEDVSLTIDMMGRGPLRDLARLFEAAARGEGARSVRFESLSRGTCPRDVLWALNVLMYDCGDASLALRGILPSAWRSFARHVFEDRCGAGALEEPHVRPREAAGASGTQAAVAPDGTGRSAASAADARDAQAPGGAKRVLVSVLGTFSVHVDGVPVSPCALAKRKARDLICALALARGHKMNKRDLVIAIWGDCDYSSGSQRLYETIASARRILRGGDKNSNPVVSSRFGGTVALDADSIAFDIDEFVQEATLAVMSEGDDRATVRHAVRTHQVFGTGVEAMPVDVNGELASQAKELAVLHADACLVGSQAALREGKDYLAVELARASLENDGLREDAVKCMIAALGVQGRRAEVVEVYEGYRARLRERFGRGPGGELDDVVREILCDGDSAWSPADGAAAAGDGAAADDGAAAGDVAAAGEGLVAVEGQALLGGEDPVEDEAAAGERSVPCALGSAGGKQVVRRRKVATKSDARKADRGRGHAGASGHAHAHSHAHSRARGRKGRSGRDGGRMAGGASA